ncbi:MAG: hypothetical protein AB1894_05315 [Chloroflexota bacterium]
MNGNNPVDYANLYESFQSPITALDCGDRCAPYNENNAPFCCDTRHAVPTAYDREWAYLRAHTDLWHIWEADQEAETQALRSQTPAGQVLIACQGHRLCQRGFRAITCRAFPFFPYLTREGEFVGLSYYWEYEQRCWVISHLEAVTATYLAQFVSVYERLFEDMPEERENFRYHSTMMRRVFGRRKRAIPLLHRNGNFYKVTPRNGRMRRMAVELAPKFGVYQIAAELPFPDELEASARLEVVEE